MRWLVTALIAITTFLALRVYDEEKRIARLESSRDWIQLEVEGCQSDTHKLDRWRSSFRYGGMEVRANGETYLPALQPASTMDYGSAGALYK